jgi:hypothetical protein
MKKIIHFLLNLDILNLTIKILLVSLLLIFYLKKNLDLYLVFFPFLFAVASVQASFSRFLKISYVFCFSITDYIT